MTIAFCISDGLAGAGSFPRSAAAGLTVAAVQDDIDDANSRANIARVVGAIGLIAGMALARRRS